MTNALITAQILKSNREDPAARLVLASASPRRAELLTAAGIPFEVEPANVDEATRRGEAPEAYVVRVARDKARAVSRRRPDRLVLAADTTVVVDGLILGKPEGVEDAARMLRMLSGRTHEVLTGVCLAPPASGGRLPPEPSAALSRTEVEFCDLSEDEVAWYIETGEPMDKAGAYAIQGLASRFVTRISGSYSNVVGLPVALVYQLLARG
jgi:septum formation protein